MRLSQERCEPIKAGTKPLTYDEAERLARELRQWETRDSFIFREFKFRDFHEAIGFVNKVADIAEDQDHHPDIFISYNKVSLSLSTHKIKGFSRNDFILAAKIDEITAAQRT